MVDRLELALPHDALLAIVVADPVLRLALEA
jgi:hypothetical protein